MAVREPLVDEPVALEGHALVSHLRGHLVLPCRLGQLPRLVDRARQRLFAIHVPSTLDGGHGDDRVRVVGRAHDDAIDALLLFVEHLAKILVLLGLRVAIERARRVVPVHVGQRDDVLILELLEVPAALTPDAHTGQVQLFAGRRCAGAAQHMSWHQGKDSSADTGRKHAPAGHGRQCRFRGLTGSSHGLAPVQAHRMAYRCFQAYPAQSQIEPPGILGDY
jgi:hypothetical protein